MTEAHNGKMPPCLDESDDDSRYRSREEVEKWRKRDPLLSLRHRLPPAAADAIEEETSTIAAEAVEWAMEQRDPDPDSVQVHTYA